MKTNRAQDWLNQAENDLAWAKDSLEKNHFSQTCFICQQVGEKALKALAYRRNLEPRGHSIRDLAIALNINGDILSSAKKLDLYYISARYPDAFPSGAPFEFFSVEQAREAYQLANKIILSVKEEFQK